jgi:hypothetical protein
MPNVVDLDVRRRDVVEAMESERHAALHDGLSLNGVLQPQLVGPGTAAAGLRRHLHEVGEPA